MYKGKVYAKLIFCLSIFSTVCLCSYAGGTGEPEPIEAPTKKKGFFKKMMNLESEKNFRYYPVPLISFSDQTSLELGLTNFFMFRLGNDSTNLLSSAHILFHYSLNSQLTTGGSWYLYFKNYRFTGRLRYRSYPETFYGVGNETQLEDEEIYDIQFFRLRMEYLWKVKKNLYVGPSYEFENPFNLQYEDGGLLSETEVQGSEGYLVSGLGFNLQYDNTNCSVFPTQGINFEFRSTFYHPASGFEKPVGKYSFRFRHYKNWRNGKHVLASDLFAGFHAGTPPFTQMFKVGGETILRGYIRGRYRDNHLLYGQVEYRFPIVWRFRGVAFVGMGDVTDDIGRLSLADIKYSYGGGIRFVLDRNEHIAIRFDYARGREGSQGFYIGLNQAF